MPVKMINLISNNKYGVKLLLIINSIITKLVYGLYPLLLIILIINKDIRIIKVTIVPGISFVIVSIFRKWFNAKRPYEILDIIPIIQKDSKGNSFPSRHVFSIFSIAMAYYYIVQPIGLVLMFLGVILAVVRVLGGVHFPRDVIAGAIIGLLSGIIGLYLI